MSAAPIPGGAARAIEELAGQVLPGGRAEVASYEDWLMRDVALAAPSWEPSLHPLSVFAGLQRSIGMSLSELFALCGSSPEEGPMLGETRIEMLASMAPGRAYDVRAAITGAQRKVGRTAGTIDIVELTIEAFDDVGAVVARLVNSYIFRRAA